MTDEREILVQYYQTHHRHLTTMVSNELTSNSNALIIDCHSFSGAPLPCDEDQTTPRPDICIGTDSFHTPDLLVKAVEKIISSLGYTYKVNQPYAGSIVPMDFYHKNSRMISIMIEVNRSLYMDESTGMKTVAFEITKHDIQVILNSIKTQQLRGKH
jgi:N-formylglutamate deformylase